MSSVHDVHNRHVVRRRDVLLVIAICAAYGAIGVGTRPPSPFTAPDTAVYVDASPVVPVGYPLFLDMLGIDGAAIAQPLVFAASIAFLGTELIALTGNALLAILVITGIVLIPEMRTYHASLLTESLFMSGLVGFLAATTRFVRAPTWKSALLAACIAALTATVRRNAVTFAVIVALMIVFRWRDLPARRLVVAAAVGPLILIGMADFVAARALHGDRLTSLTGPHVFAKAALIDAPATEQRPADDVQARLAGELDERYAPIRRLLAAAPREIRASLTLYYETCLQGPCVSTLRQSLALPDAVINARLARAGAARIRRAPWKFAVLTLTHYVSLWTVFKLQHPDTARLLTGFLAAQRPVPFERETFKVAPGERIEFASRHLVRWVQPAVLGIGLFTLAIAAIGTIGAVRGTASQPLIVATLASLTAHGTLLFSALGAAGISRFALAAFPAVVTASGVGLWWVGQKWLGAARGPRYH